MGCVIMGLDVLFCLCRKKIKMDTTSLAPPQLWQNPRQPQSVDSVYDDFVTFGCENNTAFDAEEVQSMLSELCELCVLHETETAMQVQVRMIQCNLLFRTFLFLRHLGRHVVL
jgi:hypothetical protein